MTDIYVMDERTGDIQHRSIYSIPPVEAMIAFIHQEKKDWNFWMYPKQLDGIWESKIRKGTWHYEDIQNGRCIMACERREVTA